MVVLEYWVEENIRPANKTPRDEVILKVLKPIVCEIREKDILTWHFFRETDNWRGRDQVEHIRFRAKVKNEKLRESLSDYIKKKLNNFQTIGLIQDHYLGNHGAPNDWYTGEVNDWDETSSSPKGWNLIQKHFEIGSEIAILLIEGRTKRKKLGIRFKFSDINHFLGNQTAHFQRMIKTSQGTFIGFPLIPDQD